MSKDDFVVMKVSIFNRNGIMDFSSFKWSKIRYEKTPDNSFLDYERSIAKSGQAYFDRIRFCELETAVHLWKNEKSLTKREKIEDIYKLFNKHFKILSFYYDFSKFYIFKITMEAKLKGLVKKNNYLNFEIDIKNSDDDIMNETHCLGVLNNVNKMLEVRTGQIICLYITDLYG